MLEHPRYSGIQAPEYLGGRVIIIGRNFKAVQVLSLSLSLSHRRVYEERLVQGKGFYTKQEGWVANLPNRLFFFTFISWQCSASCPLVTIRFRMPEEFQKMIQEGRAATLSMSTSHRTK